MTTLTSEMLLSGALFNRGTDCVTFVLILPPFLVRILGVDNQLSDLFEDEDGGTDEGAAEAAAAEAAAAAAAATAASATAAAAAAAETAAAEKEAPVEAASSSLEKEAVGAWGGEGTPEGTFAQLSAARGGLLTLGDLLG